MSTADHRTEPLRGRAAGSQARNRPAPRPRVVRRQAVVRRVDPWSVLKLSLVFYFFLLVVVMLGLAMLWGLLGRIGVVEQTMEFLETLNFQVELNIGNIARAIFLVGVLQVILLTGINVFLAFLYNLVADLLGGLRITLVEEDRGRVSARGDGSAATSGAREPTVSGQRGNGRGAESRTQRLH